VCQKCKENVDARAPLRPPFRPDLRQSASSRQATSRLALARGFISPRHLVKILDRGGDAVQSSPDLSLRVQRQLKHGRGWALRGKMPGLR
jgi:hypothetical protein